MPYMVMRSARPPLPLTGILFSAVFIAAPVSAQSPPVAPHDVPVVAVTHHSGTFSGQSLKYAATVAETILRDSTGALLGAMVTTAYVREDVNRDTRPVMFLFNGGPGASSTPLHFSAFGPVRRVGQGGAQRMIGNPDSPLDAVDLVFIDPIGTGYSRHFTGVDGRRFWSRSSDAWSVRTVIEEWVKVNGRERSPKYLCGESYGTTRVALMLRQQGTVTWDGVLLFAVVGNAPGREMPLVGTFPTLATTAWFHGRVPRDGKTLEQVYDAAVRFARTEYVNALIRGAGLPAEERTAIAGKMSALIGLPADLIARRDLRVSRDTFMFNLLKNQGLRTGQLDGRATSRLDAPPRRGPYADPGFSYNPEDPPLPSRDSVGGAPIDASSALERYFKETLGFKTAETYNGLNLDVNAAWNYETRDDVNPAIGEAMRRDPKLRLLWTGGYYDISTPMYAAQYALDQAGIPGERVTAAFFPAGHSVFVEQANRTALSQAVRRFVTDEAGRATRQ